MNADLALEVNIDFTDLEPMARLAKKTGNKNILVLISAKNIVWKFLDPEHVFFTQVTTGITGNYDVLERYAIPSNLFIEKVKSMPKGDRIRLRQLLVATDAEKIDVDRDPYMPRISWDDETALIDHEQLFKQIPLISKLGDRIEVKTTDEGIELKSIQSKYGTFEGLPLDSCGGERKSTKAYVNWFNPKYIETFLTSVKTANMLHVKTSPEKPLGIEIHLMGWVYEFLVAPVERSEK